MLLKSYQKEQRLKDILSNFCLQFGYPTANFDPPSKEIG